MFRVWGTAAGTWAVGQEAGQGSPKIRLEGTDLLISNLRLIRNLTCELTMRLKCCVVRGRIGTLQRNMK